MRREKKREIEHELRREAAGKRTKASREEDRDVSERVALGMPVPQRAEGEFDQRLYNLDQDEGAEERRRGFLARAGREDDDDQVYTTSLFRDAASAVYKPSSSRGKERESAAALQYLEELKAAGGTATKFAGSAEGGRSSEGDKRAPGPVQFERAGNPVAPVAPPAVSREGDEFAAFGAVRERKSSSSRPSRTMIAGVSSSGGNSREAATAMQNQLDDGDDPTGEYSMTVDQILDAAGGGKRGRKHPQKEFVRSSGGGEGGGGG